MHQSPFLVATVPDGAAALPVASSKVRSPFRGPGRSGACMSFGTGIPGSLSTGSSPGAPIPADAVVAYSCGLDSGALPLLAGSGLELAAVRRPAGRHRLVAASGRVRA